MCNVAAPFTSPTTPPLSPVGFGQNFTFPQSAASGSSRLPLTPPSSPPPVPSRYPLPAPEERLGSCLAGSLRLVKILGTGAYGVVYKAVDIYTGVYYAVKTLSKFNADGTPLDQRQMAFQTREIRLHWDASAHPNVVSMLKIIDGLDCIFVVLEYCPEGDLFSNITDHERYVGKDDLAKRIFLQILDAVEYCHSRRIYHRDLKPENILVTAQGETVKLADFGLATGSDRSDDYGCGSTFYMSPECLDHSSRRPFYYCAPNDIWSLGVILVNLTCGRNPWKQASYDDLTYRAYTRSTGFLKTILPVTDELNDILCEIFTRNPEQRITLSALKQRILACPRFTYVQRPAPLSTPPRSPEPTTTYVQEGAFPDSIMYGFATSPTASDDGSSDGEYSDNDSVCDTGSDDGSLDGLDHEDRPDCPDCPADSKAPAPAQTQAPTGNFAPAEPRSMNIEPQFNPYTQGMPQVPQGNFIPRSGLTQLWDMLPPVPYPVHFYSHVQFPVSACY